MNHYQTLQVVPDAGDDVIRAAYKALAQRWHPDKNPNNSLAEIKFKAIAEAYRVLSDGDLRKAYDDSLNRDTTSANAPEESQSRQTQSREQNEFHTEAFQKIKIYVDGEYSRKVAPDRVIRDLQQRNVPEHVIAYVMLEVFALKNSKKGMIWGAIWLAAGSAITGLGYFSAVQSGGGKYLVFGGAIVWGLIKFLSSAYYYWKSKSSLRAFNNEFSENEDLHSHLEKQKPKGKSYKTWGRSDSDLSDKKENIDKGALGKVNYKNVHAFIQQHTGFFLASLLIITIVYSFFRPQDLGLGNFESCRSRLPSIGFDDKSKLHKWGEGMNECIASYSKKYSSEELAGVSIRFLGISSQNDGLIAAIHSVQGAPLIYKIKVRLSYGPILRYVEIEQGAELKFAGDFLIPLDDVGLVKGVTDDPFLQLVEVWGITKVK